NFAPWRQDAQARDYASSISLPLTADGRPFGVLNIYASEPDAFDGDELKLLTELAGELAYGIGVQRQRAEWAQVEARLREQNEILTNSNEGVMIVNLDNQVTLWNRGAEKLFGWTAGEALGCPPKQLLPIDDPAAFFERRTAI